MFEDIHFRYLYNVRDKSCIEHSSVRSLGQIVEIIKSATDKSIEKNYSSIFTSLKAEKDEVKQKELKASLPCFISGNYENDHVVLKKAINFDTMIYDIDWYDEEKSTPDKPHGFLTTANETATWDFVTSLPETAVAFRSPRRGIKIIFLLDKLQPTKFVNSATTASLYEATYNFYGDKLLGTEKWDHATVEMRRACFISYDPNLYINEKCIKLCLKDNISEIIKLMSAKKAPTFSSVDDIPDDSEFSTQEYNRVFDGIKFLVKKVKTGEKMDEKTWFRIGCALATQDEFGRKMFFKLSRADGRDSDIVIQKKWDSINKKKTLVNPITLGTYFDLLKKMGWTNIRHKIQREISTRYKFEIDKYLEKTNSYLMPLFKKGQVSLWFGKGGGGKTWAAFKLAWAASKGEVIWGYHRPYVPIKTVIFDFDDTLAEFYLKYLEPSGIKSIDLNKNENFQIVDSNFLSEDGVSSHFAEDISFLEGYIKKHNLNLIVIDNVSRMGNKVPSDNTTSRKFMNDISSLAQRTESHIVLIHHQNKPNVNIKKEDVDKKSLFTGSTAFWDLSREVIMIETDESNGLISYIKPLKAHTDFGSVVQVLKPSGINGNQWSRMDVEYQHIHNEIVDKNFIVLLMLHVLTDKRIMKSEDLKKSIYAGKISSGTLKRSLKKLEEEGYAVFKKTVGKSSDIEITEKGEIYFNVYKAKQDKIHEDATKKEREHNEDIDDEIKTEELSNPVEENKALEVEGFVINHNDLETKKETVTLIEDEKRPEPIKRRPAKPKRPDIPPEILAEVRAEVADLDRVVSSFSNVKNDDMSEILDELNEEI